MIPRSKKRLHRSRLLSFGANASGVALIEFAMVFPVLIVLYLGGFQLMDAVSVYRKVTTTTRSLADLGTHNSTVSTNDVSTILEASAQVMAPYTTSGGTFRITMVDVDSAGQAKVKWSQSKNGSALTTGANYTLPTSIKRSNQGIVVCDVTYTYKPIAFFSLMGDIPFKDQIFMLPRASNTITRTS